MAGGEAEIGTRTTEKAGARFERSLEVAIGILTKDVDFDCLGFVERLESHDALHEERLGIFEVYMEEGHHREGGVYALDLPGHEWGVSFHRTNRDITHELRGLGKVVVPHCGRHELAGLL